MTQLDERTAVSESPYKHIKVRQVGGAIGASVTGIRADGHADPAAFAELRAALLRHKVVFLRDQHGVTDQEQVDFAGLFGPVTKPHPLFDADRPGVLPLDSAVARANQWHTDVTFTDRPPALSILRAVTMPPYGGTTVWANTVTAYQALPPALQALVNGLRSVHTNAYDYAAARELPENLDSPQAKAAKAAFARRQFETEHPVVRIHPETGERSLLLGQFFKTFIGLSSVDSRDLFALLQRHITRLENTVRWTWSIGDIAIWDNRATQHYAVDYFDGLPRRVHRVTVAGKVPVGIDGEPSKVLKGDASDYSVLGI